MDGSLLFTNDLQTYKIETPLGDFVYVLSVQLISNQLIGNCDEKRARQAELVSQVYEDLRLAGIDLIVVLGTLNAPRYAKSISPIMNTDMIDIANLSNFEVEFDTGIDLGYYRMGAYCKGVNIEQNDYLLTSPMMQNMICGSGMNRKAMWPMKKPEWETYDSVVNEKDSASEHPLLWVTLNMKTSVSRFKKCA